MSIYYLSQRAPQETKSACGFDHTNCAVRNSFLQNNRKYSWQQLTIGNTDCLAILKFFQELSIKKVCILEQKACSLITNCVLQKRSHSIIHVPNLHVPDLIRLCIRIIDYLQNLFFGRPRLFSSIFPSKS